ncbi:MAG: hypothetical protein ABR517_05870 [Thermoanaerobaculia bacterium]
MESDFTKRLDDVIRQELLILGYDYGEVVAAIEDSRSEGTVARLQPPYEDLEFEVPEDDESDVSFAARVRRRLKAVLEAPQREPGPDEAP